MRIFVRQPIAKLPLNVVYGLAKVLDGIGYAATAGFIVPAFGITLSRWRVAAQFRRLKRQRA